MAGAALLPTFDLLLRGGVALMLLMLAVLMARDHGRVLAGRLGAAFALGTAAFALCSCGPIHAALGAWGAPIIALSTGNNLVFWLFARSLFDDGFRLRPWHGAAWLAFTALGLIQGLVLAPARSTLAQPADIALSLAAPAFALLAIVQTVASWGGDLVERRRRLRLFIVGGSAGYILLNAAANGLGLTATAPALANLIQALGLVAVAAPIAWSLLGVPGGQALFPGPAATPEPTADETAPLDDAERALVANLRRRMSEERLYRQEGLTIGRLAALQGVPEYRLRRLINQGLGYRNFSAFLNGYRIAEAKAALADASQAEVPILTIALDAGFASLGPFNRAFKAETGTTPSAWRRDAGIAELDPPRSGSRIPISASRISNSA